MTEMASSGTKAIRLCCWAHSTGFTGPPKYPVDSWLDDLAPSWCLVAPIW